VPLIVMIILIRRGVMPRPREFRRILSGAILLGLGAVLAGGSNVLTIINGCGSAGVRRDEV